MGWYEEYIKQKKEKIIKFGKSVFEINTMYCPYCAHEQNEMYDLDLSPSGDRVENHCEKCEKTFFYEVNLAICTTKPKEK